MWVKGGKVVSVGEISQYTEITEISGSPQIFLTGSVVKFLHKVAFCILGKV